MWTTQKETRYPGSGQPTESSAGAGQGKEGVRMGTEGVLAREASNLVHLSLSPSSSSPRTRPLGVLLQGRIDSPREACEHNGIGSISSYIGLQ